ncbi:saccharopine dehydrogenase family protein [Thermococcus sp. GR7]|uniref:saccharopine dehydrogenase family protein n=1 Tax=unclassified Thermococcus TaxID=2627626 RepID=UPI001430B035|nr:MULTISPECIES: saccharopine dehydrogenase family protein [unclassified Thermococcus]NJE46411.1 saccharopine dehydrogenase family protein [Thermococcus sp. GR7]NJE77670.1 saccharopine dehydrogenase family protein [Thermococcus sp. GR4]NJF23963.1 saccharopine dehydrogenase family protein [Thermococcus sp. GR5]
MKVLVLGAGNVGRAIAWDLRDEFEVWVGDRSEERLNSVKDFAETVKIDASNFDSLVETMKSFELVVGALPGRFGYSSVKAAIKAGVDMVDVSFMPENPLELREEAEKAQVTVIFDAGFAPGLSHILMGRIWQEIDELKEGYIYVGGLPREPRPPLYYRITWSPKDLIEEYTRPARVIRNGNVTAVDPFEKIERVTVGDFEFEAFVSDGLRSLLESVKAEKLEEWTLRWPGHLEKMKVLRELGFFKPEHIDKTLEVITPLMTYESPDFSIMQVVGRGILDGKKKEIGYLLYDEEKEGFTSMARVTGFTAAIVARLVAEKGCIFGVIPPEILGMRIDTFTRITEELAERGITLERWENAPPGDS